MSKVEETEDNNFINSVNASIFPAHSKTHKQINKKVDENYSKMANMRVIQKRLVYVIGLSANLAFKDNHLSKFEYFGQYGRITKLVVNKNKVYNMNGLNGPSYSAYVTFSCPGESSLAILALDNTEVDNHLLRASFGTTKYCSNFLRSTECFNKECLYLHAFADEGDILDREDMNTNKSIFTTQQLFAISIADIFNPNIRQKLFLMRFNKTILPSPHTLYTKEIVLERMRALNEDSSCGSVYSNDFNISYTSYEGDAKDYYKNSTFNMDHHHHHPSIYRQRKNSRFSFSTNYSSDETIEIPNFVSNLISKKFSRYTFFKKIINDDEDFTYFDKVLLKEYGENNPWARSIVGWSENEKMKNCIEKLNENEERKLLNKFNSA